MHAALVAVAVANVWAAPGTATIPNEPALWPTPAITYSQRLGLVGHMPTQVLFDERVLVLARRGAWTKIAVPDQPSPLDRRGYPGWVLTSQLQLRPAPREAGVVTVTVPKAKLSNGTPVSFATELLLDRRLGRVDQVMTPKGVSWIPVEDVRPLPRTRADLVRTAKLFLGLHYLWGGLSAWGYDCSGLTWAVYRAHGITIPRDADAQYAAGTPVSLADAKPGDLIFYEGARPGHVAMLVGGGMMIESPNSANEVRVVPIRPGSVGVRRFL